MPSYRRLPFAAALGVLLTACVAYRPAPVSAPSLVATAATPPAGPLAFDDAVRFGVTNNPELRALRARIGAINTSPGPEPIGISAEYDMDGRWGGAISLDALSLLGIGPRKAERALRWARRDEAVRVHHERARDVAGEIAEAYAVERAHASLPEVDVHVAAEAYVRAGLESGAAQGAVEATAGEWQAERTAREAERRTNRRALRRLLGARPDGEIAIVAPAADWPALPAPSEAALLAARADLQTRLAAYEVADAELRSAVAAQYPGIEIEPGIAFDPSALFGGVRLRLPVGADREAVAAECAREAARQDLLAAILDALEDAAAAREEADVAARRVAAARVRAKSSEDVLRTAKARLEAGSGMLLEAVFAAREVVMAAADLREAEVEAARARVRAARAAGWPGPEVVR